MSRAPSSALALLLLFALAAPVAAGENEPGPQPTPAAGEVVPGEVIVKWRDHAGDPMAAEARGLSVLAELGAPEAAMPELVSTEGRPVADVLAELQADPAVEYAEPNYVVHLAVDEVTTAVAVNDPKTGPQYSLDRMRVRDAWALSTGSARTVAVLDTGIDFGHPDLAGRVLAGHDFVNNDGDARDDNGHGTWVSGIVGANTNDGFGIAGISWRDRILPVKIMNANGTGDSSDLTAGIVWATDRGANVINMSVGGFPYSQYVHDAVRYAWGRGVVLVGAAGNNAVEGPFYPASYPEVISVSASQVDDEFSSWSNYGADVDVSAPGASILTTNCAVCKPVEQDLSGDHRFTYISGTSFAAPNVAGVVALIWARYPTMTNAQVVDRLKTTVDDLGYAGWDNRYGRGRVNALRAVGGAAPAIPLGGQDAAEGNNTLAAARLIAIGSTVRPNIYPAGDVDVFAVDAPMGGRVDIAVGPVLDARPWPWNRSSLPIDPVLNVYRADGSHIVTVDADNPAATDRASVQLSTNARLLVRVHNYMPNGNRGAYALTTTFVDNVGPTLASIGPVAGATRVSYDGTLVTATFTEPVSGVSDSSFQLRRGGTVVPATVSYDPASRLATLRPSVPLAGEVAYQVSLTSTIVDLAGNPLPPKGWQFTTGKAAPRISGSDRYATSAALSASAFGPGVPVAYVATGAAFPDALAGGPAARVAGGPLLLVAPTSVPAATAAELTRLRPGRIVVLGSAGAVSAGVLDRLRTYTAGSVTRIAGADRYATAAAISASAFPTGSNLVFVATGSNYPDALAAGADAARQRAPILLVGTSDLPPATAAELTRLRPTHIVVMGGPTVVTDAVVARLRAHASRVDRIAGADRYETAVSLSRAVHAANSVSTVYLATGNAYPDGLSAGPVAGGASAPLLLVQPTSLPAAVADELRRLDPATVVFVGGPSAISDAVRNAVRALWP